MTLFSIFLAATLVGVVVLLLLCAWLAKLGRGLLPDEQALSKAEMREHLLWNLVYVNPADPRSWVPKVYGLGWTLNMRTRRNGLLFLALVGLDLLLAVATVFAVFSFVP